MDKVSIIIPFYNDPYVGRAIKSALDQTYENKEIVVVNDGSTSHSEKIKPFLDKIIYIEKGNGGTASALNTGIKSATGNYFSWLSSDDLYEPDKIKKQLAFMKSSKASISYGNYYLINGEDKVISLPAGIGISNKKSFLEYMLGGCIINGCTVMVEMSVFKVVGYFDEGLKYAQDYDMWLRILPFYDFHYFNEPLVKYRVHQGMGSKKYEREIPREINIVKKRHGKKLFFLIQKIRKTKVSAQIY
ncbi:glycosyltransferase [Lentibacillus sediminis]|uniref:glycosyltransferase n=1 Tax=Lentibacillus sediminis TaxID=1940529 RepID=UPI000C1BC285|nr:glycosyltransferase [Lentibacillus sediminis]